MAYERKPEKPYKRGYRSPKRKFKNKCAVCGVKCIGKRCRKHIDRQEISEKGKLWWRNRTPQEHLDFTRKMSKLGKERWARATKKERDKWAKLVSEARAQKAEMLRIKREQSESEWGYRRKVGNPRLGKYAYIEEDDGGKLRVKN